MFQIPYPVRTAGPTAKPWLKEDPGVRRDLSPDLRHDLSPELGSWQSPGDGFRWDRSFLGWERGPGAAVPRRGGEGRFTHPGSSMQEHS